MSAQERREREEEFQARALRTEKAMHNRFCGHGGHGNNLARLQCHVAREATVNKVTSVLCLGIEDSLATTINNIIPQATVSVHILKVVMVSELPVGGRGGPNMGRGPGRRAGAGRGRVGGRTGGRPGGHVRGHGNQYVVDGPEQAPVAAVLVETDADEPMEVPAAAAAVQRIDEWYYGGDHHYYNPNEYGGDAADYGDY